MSKKQKRDYTKLDAAKGMMNDMFDTFLLVVELNSKKIKYCDQLFMGALYSVFYSLEKRNRQNGKESPEIDNCLDFLARFKRAGFKFSSPDGEDGSVLVDGLMAMGQGFIVKPINKRAREPEYFLAITPRAMTKTIRQAYTERLSSRVKMPQYSAG